MTSTTESRREAKLDKVKGQLDELFKAGKFYEAQQTYKTLQARMTATKQYAEASELMLGAVTRLLEHQQVSAAGELALLVVESLVKSDSKCDSKHIEMFAKLAATFPKGGEEQAIGFLKQALKFSTERGEHKQGDPSLHMALARLYWRTEDYGAAQKHFLRGGQVAEHARAVASWARKGYKSEADMFVTRTVLQYLCLGDLKSANQVFAECKQELKDCAEALASPLTNFTGFLLRAVERDAAPLFALLRQKYAISLSRDSSFTQYLDKIGEVYFKIAAPAGLFDLLKTL